MPPRGPSRRLTPAQRALCEQHIRLALKISCRWQAARPEAARLLGGSDDVDSIALWALARVCSYFDPNRGYCFSSYAWPAIWRWLSREATGAGTRGKASARVNTLIEHPPSREPDPPAAAAAAEVGDILDSIGEDADLVRTAWGGGCVAGWSEGKGITRERGRQRIERAESLVQSALGCTPRRLKRPARRR